MENRPGLVALGPSEPVSTLSALPWGALGTPCSSLCQGGWCRGTLGHRAMHRMEGMCHQVAVSPPTHPHAHQIHEYQYFGGLQDFFVF